MKTLINITLVILIIAGILAFYDGWVSAQNSVLEIYKFRNDN